MIGLLAQMLVHSWTKWGLKSVRVIKGHAMHAVVGARDVVVSTRCQIDARNSWCHDQGRVSDVSLASHLSH